MPIPLILLFAVVGGIAVKATADEQRRRKRRPNPPPARDVGLWPFDAPEWFALRRTVVPRTARGENRVSWEGPRKLDPDDARAWRWQRDREPDPPEGWATFTLFAYRNGQWVRA